ncbi:MAG: glycosyltransferase family 39 protein [Sphingomicrobium sp.]
MTSEGRGPRDERWTRWALTIILIIAAVVRLAGIHFSLWLDESATLAFARQPMSHLWGVWMLRETNPPLFYTLLKGWQMVAGMADPLARLLPIAIGLVGVWGISLLGRAIGGARAGLLAAALLALSAIHVDYSLQLRGYGLAHGGVIFACLGMVRFLQERGHKWLLLYVTGAAVALYGHTTLALFVVLANAAMLLLLRRDRRALAQWFAANVLLALIWGWWGWITLRQLGAPHNFSWITVPSLAQAWRTTSIALVPLYLRSDTAGGSALLAAMLGGSGIYAVRRAQAETSLLAILALGAPLLLFAVSQKTPVLLPRTLFWASGPLFSLLAAAIVSITERRMALFVAALAIVLSAVGLAAWYPDGQQEQWPAAAAVLDRRATERDIWVADDAVALALVHYLPNARARIIVVDRPGAPHERWAAGLFPGRHIGAPEAGRRFGEQCHVAVLARGDYDPGPLLVALKARPTAIGSRARNPLVWLWDCGQGPSAR